LTIPDDSRVQITIKTGPFGRVRVDGSRFKQIEPGIYVNHDGETEPAEKPGLSVVASTVFGSIYIS
jgi:hypothetical protein